MLHFADGRLLAVGMFLEQQLVDGEFDDRLLVIERLVLLFIDNLQLRLKEAKDRMLEPLRLDDGPLFQAVLRQVHLVDRLFVPRVGVEALFAHRLVELVHLVRDFVLRGQLRFLVDLRVDGLAFLRVGLVKMLFVQLGDAVEVRFFLFVIERANLRRALEQHVLEVMCQAGGHGRVLFAAGAHGDLRLEPRRLVVFRQINRQAVVQLINLHGHRVFRIRLVDPLESGQRSGRREREDDRDDNWPNGFAIRVHDWAH